MQNITEKIKEIKTFQLTIYPPFEKKDNESQSRMFNQEPVDLNRMNN